MSMYYIQYIPAFSSTSKKNNGEEGRRRYSKYNDVGVFYLQGIGCLKHDNCFTCPYEDCIFLLNNHGKQQTNDELKYIANRGDGIKVW